MKKFILSIIILVGFLSINAQPLYINPMQYNPTQLVQDILVTGCLQSSNVTYTGDILSKGYFQRSPLVNNFIFEHGVILSSGTVMNAIGPNDSPSTSAITTGGSDPQLQTLISSTINDASVLEFDFIPHDNSFSFRYVFGSEEYPEWVGSTFNDVFGFFLTGPGCPGTVNYFNKNIATIPGTTIPVSINNVNAGINNTYYIANTQVNSAIEYDGHTIALTATACVVPCATYHIKLAVGDAGDSSYDSGVFLEGGSLSSGDQIDMNTFDNQDNETELFYEGCEYYYVFSRADLTNINDTVFIHITTSGTASTTTDITGFPNLIVLLPGQVSDTVYFSVLFDGVVENEYLIITITNGCPCTPELLSDTLWIIDVPFIEGGIVQNDTIICSEQNQTIVLNAWSNLDPTITSYLWSNGSTSSSIIVTPIENIINTYSVTISDICSQTITDNINILFSNLSNPSINNIPTSCYNICDGQIITNLNTGVPPYSYEWNNGQNTQNINNLCDGSYILTITDNFGCENITTTIISEPLEMDFNIITTPATCEGFSNGEIFITVINGQYGGNWSYSTSGQSYLVTTNPMNQFSFEGLGAGTYTLNVTDGIGCHYSEIVDLGELSVVSAANIDSVLCYGDSSGSIYLNVVGGTPPYTYLWSNGQTGLNLLNIQSGNYSITITDSKNCMYFNYFYVGQPEDLRLYNTTNDIICIGEIANLTAWANGGTAPYSYTWYNNNGILLSNGENFSSPLVESQLILVKVTDNNGCEKGYNASYVTVYPELSISLFTPDDSICSGDSTLIYVYPSGGNGGPYTITNMDGNIVDFPIFVSPNVTTVYNFYINDGCGTPQSNDWIVINVLPNPEIDIEFSPSSGCVPLDVYLNDINHNEGDTYQWILDNGINTSYISENRSSHIILDQPGLYDTRLQVTSKDGCKFSRHLNDNIEVYPLPDGNVYPSEESSSILNPIVFFNYTGSNWQSAITYFGDGSEGHISPIDYDISYLYPEIGRYSVITIFQTGKGCVDTVYIDIDILPYYDLVVPNVINPTSPIIENSVFLPLFNVDINFYKLHIYDRWGEVIFMSDDFNVGWNGRFKNGKIVKSDTYIYKILYGVGSEVRTATGRVTVLQ